MRVKDLIKYLQKQNPDDIVILRDFGQDTGDITFFYEDNEGLLSNGPMESNLRIMSYNEIFKELKFQQSYDLKKFLDIYGIKDNFKNEILEHQKRLEEIYEKR